jgi:hypothetical protein
VIGPYVSVVRGLIRREGVTSIVDLGCGDFEVAGTLLSPELTYVGRDIVPGLVATNAARFSSERVKFRTLDIVTDALLEGDLCIIQASPSASLEPRYHYGFTKSEAVSSVSGH